MADCGRSDEDQTTEMKKRWSPRYGDRDPLIPCNVASFEPSDSLKENGRSRLNHEIPL